MTMASISIVGCFFVFIHVYRLWKLNNKAPLQMSLTVPIYLGLRSLFLHTQSLINMVILPTFCVFCGLFYKSQSGEGAYWCYTTAKNPSHLMTWLTLSIHLTAMSWIFFCYQRTLKSLNMVRKAQLSIQNGESTKGTESYDQVRFNKVQQIVNRRILSYCLMYGYQLIAGIAFIFMATIKHAILAGSKNKNNFSSSPNQTLAPINQNFEKTEETQVASYI
ncbi:hypothetical protein G9A89_003682 [Geosiphon pyriformis]|nr:hypothetical protein G9A89_003682 [Geosiphon pyriformis]